MAYEKDYYGDGEGAYLRWSHNIGPFTPMPGCSEDDELSLCYVENGTPEEGYWMLDDGYDQTPYSPYARWDEWVRLARLIIDEDEKRRVEMLPGEWDSRYRILSEGEIIQAGDEWLINDEVGWEPAGAHSVGKKAADPLCASHTWFRRLIGTAGRHA